MDESAPDDPDKPDPDKPDPDRPDPDKPDPDKPDPDKPTPAVKQFSLVFELNGGSLDGEEGTITRTYDEGTEITLPAPTRKGYSFDYWKGSRYEAGQVYKVSEDHTFEAQWKKDNGSGSGARTGDETRILNWMALMTLSLLGLILAALFRRKEQ